MNGRDYIITGSSDEHLVRVCCAQTGRRLRDIYFEVILILCVLSLVVHVVLDLTKLWLWFSLVCREKVQRKPHLYNP